jgi:CubicO group peptidase (beta-lactamase class C family)
MGGFGWQTATVLVVGACVACGPASSPDQRDPKESLPLASGPEVRALDAQVADYLAPLAQAGRLSGNVLVGTRDSILVLQSYGLSDVEAGTPNDPDTRFVIASITKTFTSAAILTLAAEERIDLDDPLARFAPDFPRAGEITIRQLLLHESGVGDPEMLDWFESPESPISLEELVRKIAGRPFLFDPGTDEAYSNAGYALLAWVIQQASGQPYGQYLERSLFEPLGMSRSGLFVDPGPAPGQANGYVPAPLPQGTIRTPEIDLGLAIGSGALSSTAPDLWRWAGAVADERLYSWKTLEWPYGWGREEVGEHEGIEQTGALPGFMSNLLVFPDADRFVVLLLNQEYGGWIDLGKGVAAIALGEKPPLLDLPPEVELSARAAERLVGRYADGEQPVRIALEEGDLWLYWGEWPIAKYLQPIGEATFAVPTDRGRIRFEDPDSEGVYRTMVWDYGDGSMTFARTERPE